LLHTPDAWRRAFNALPLLARQLCHTDKIIGIYSPILYTARELIFRIKL